jgi:hypothetical protein
MTSKHLLTLASALAAMPASAATFTETFDGPTLSPALSTELTAGYSFGLSGGRGVISKSAPVGSGFANITTKFSLVGDFSTTVTADRSNNGSASSGLATGHAEGFTDVYFFGANNVVANMFVPSPPGFGQTILNDSDPLVDFRIRRVGNTMFEEYDADQDGSFVIVRQASSDLLLGDVKISFFMGQEAANQGAASMAYDNLIITADAFRTAVPEPASWAMMIAGFGLAGAAARRRRSSLSHA